MYYLCNVLLNIIFMFIIINNLIKIDTLVFPHIFKIKPNYFFSMTPDNVIKRWWRMSQLNPPVFLSFSLNSYVSALSFSSI